MQDPSDFFPSQGEEQAGPDWVTPLLLLAAAALLIWKRRVIGNAVRQVLLALIHRLRALFAVRRRAPHSEEETGYFDTVEELTHDRESLHLFSPSSARIWRRDLRALRRMPDGTEKLRHGYALLAVVSSWLAWSFCPAIRQRSFCGEPPKPHRVLERSTPLRLTSSCAITRKRLLPPLSLKWLSLLERLSKRF